MDDQKERCLCCGGDPAYRFRVLRVRTLHVRDITGEKRVQTLDDFEDHAVCDSCAEQKRQSMQQGIRNSLPALLAFGAILLAGIILALVCRERDRVFLMLGLAMIAGGALGLIGTVQKERRLQADLSPRSPQELLQLAAWQAMVDHLPSKQGQEDLTYIPVDDVTRSRKNGDLMILYDLLPEIAVEAHKRILADGAQPLSDED